MTPLARLLLRSLVATASLSAGPAFAETKFDLSPYLANLSPEGDYRVFDRSTGGQRTATVLELGPWAKGWREVVLSETTGTADDGWSKSEGFLIPGKQLLSGSEVYDSGLSFRVGKPVKSLKLLVAPGKAQRISQKAKAFSGGLHAGKLESRSTWWIEGFETVETPSGTYESALRVHAVSTSLLRLVAGAFGCRNDVCGRNLGNASERTAWYAAGLGLVRAELQLRYFVDDAIVDEEAWSGELSAGSVDGVPFP